VKKAIIRFYEELNDFLAPEKRKVAFSHNFSGNPAIKDVIESLGVPHTEVDLILVNDQSVNFSYQLQAGDRVAVYPVFEAMDIKKVTKLREKPLRQPKFVLDVHLGKLAKYLRLLGFDSYYRNDLTDPELVSISVTQQRSLLTRDVGLLKHRVLTHGYWLRTTDPKQQIREVITKFDLVSLVASFSRCLECNGDIHKVAAETIYNQIPKKVRSYFYEFYQCQQCQRIYWKGSHYEKLYVLVQQIIFKEHT